MLESLRASGRKLFLATNSLWDYTHVVMNFLLSGRTGHDKNFDWLEYFDVVITGLVQSRPPPCISATHPAFTEMLPIEELAGCMPGRSSINLVLILLQAAASRSSS